MLSFGTSFAECSVMIKVKLIILFSIVFSFTAFGKDDFEFISIKERLRLHLWTQGLSEEIGPKNLPQNKKPLPEEIERALRKL